MGATAFKPWLISAQHQLQRESSELMPDTLFSIVFTSAAAPIAPAMRLHLYQSGNLELAESCASVDVFLNGRFQPATDGNKTVSCDSDWVSMRGYSLLQRPRSARFTEYKLTHHFEDVGCN